MPFKFRYLCELLQSLEDNRAKKSADGPWGECLGVPIINAWFNRHDEQIPRQGAAAVAFLSCLFPERRTDRVYNVQEKSLERIIGRSLYLPASRLRRLSSWSSSGDVNLASAVQRIMSEAEFGLPIPQKEVTLEEIDGLFDRIAAMYSGSSPDLRDRISNPISADDALQPLFLRL
jgi:DNA ligase 4